jgi:hypothetical protein
MKCCLEIVAQDIGGNNYDIFIVPSGYNLDGTPIYLFTLGGIDYSIQYINVSPFGLQWYISTTGPSGDIIAWWEWFDSVTECLDSHNGGFNQPIENVFNSFAVYPYECPEEITESCNCTIVLCNNDLGCIEFWEYGVQNGKPHYVKNVDGNLYEIFWDGGRWVFTKNGDVGDYLVIDSPCPINKGEDYNYQWQYYNDMGTYTYQGDCLKCPCLYVCYDLGLIEIPEDIKDEHCFSVNRTLDVNGNPYWSWHDDIDNSDWVIQIVSGFGGTYTYVAIRNGVQFAEWLGESLCPVGREWKTWKGFSENATFKTKAIDCDGQRIFARSPYLVEIDVAGSSETRVDLYIWTGEYQDIPVSPQQVLSKKVPASNQTRTIYNVSPFILEYIKNTIQHLWDSIDANAIDQWCHVRIVRYVDNQVLDFKDYYAYEGYGYFATGYNPDLGAIHLDEGTYRYYSNLVSVALGNLDSYFPSTIKIESGLSYELEYVNLISGTPTLYTLSFDEIYNVASVTQANFEDGNIVNIYKDGDLIWTSKFEPVNECKYEVIPIDFVNRYGAWQREFFFKAHTEIVSTRRKEYPFLNQNPFPPYATNLPTKKHYNINGIEKIKVNTGWVSESFGDIVTQIALSERIFIDNKPYKILTETFEKFQNINNKTINYQLEFESAYDILNYNV